jgi:hypothetical protein
MNRTAYTSTVFAPLQLVLAIVLGALPVAVVFALGGPLWPGLLAGAVVVLAGLQLATVRLAIGGDRVLVGMGPWGLTVRRLAVAEVLSARATSLGPVQIFGVGVPLRRRTTRLTVRPGPTLELELHGGELVRISTADPVGACTLLLREVNP